MNHINRDKALEAAAEGSRVHSRLRVKLRAPEVPPFVLLVVCELVSALPSGRNRRHQVAELSQPRTAERASFLGKTLFPQASLFENELST